MARGAFAPNFSEGTPNFLEDTTNFLEVYLCKLSSKNKTSVETHGAAHLLRSYWRSDSNSDRNGHGQIFDLEKGCYDGKQTNWSLMASGG